MRVPVRSGSVVRGFMSVDVDMDMAFAAVFMFVSVQLVLESFLQSPKADTQQHHADQSFAPGRKEVHRQQIPQQQRKEANDCHASGMAEAPANARNPSAPLLPHGQRCDGSEVIRSGPDMNHSRN